MRTLRVDARTWERIRAGIQRALTNQRSWDYACYELAVSDFKTLRLTGQAIKVLSSYTWTPQSIQDDPQRELILKAEGYGTWAEFERSLRERDSMNKLPAHRRYHTNFFEVVLPAKLS